MPAASLAPRRGRRLVCEGALPGRAWPLWHTDYHFYDDGDRRYATRDALGHFTYYKHDPMGRQIAVIDPPRKATRTRRGPNLHTAGRARRDSVTGSPAGSGARSFPPLPGQPS